MLAADYAQIWQCRADQRTVQRPRLRYGPLMECEKEAQGFASAEWKAAEVCPMNFQSQLHEPELPWISCR